MHAVRPAPTLEHSTCEGIYNGNLAVPNDILLVDFHELLSLQSVEHVQDPSLLGLPHVLHAKELSSHPLSKVSHHHVEAFLLHLVVQLLGQGPRHFTCSLKLGWHSRNGLGDDERRSRLIDEDGICFIHQAKVEVLALNHLTWVNCQVVAQIVEAKLRIGGVHNVTRVLLLPLLCGHGGLDEANRHAQKSQDLANILSISASEVVVGGNHENATLVFESGNEGWQQSNDGLALSGLHLS
mmetsp:Transcript_11941/g.27895  ORF Transcript_11941/g.27895 Transcript_11941/m.27895 type:complete len:239 (-) Transcript_11941:691-1407(-)